LAEHTEIKALKQQLDMLCHEVRSPLLGLNGLIEHLKSHYSEDDYLKEHLKVMGVTIEQLLFIADNTLTLAQLENEKVVLQDEIFNLNDLLAQVIKVLTPLAEGKGLVLKGESELLREQAWVLGDSVRLSQILNNLIMNGIKFTEKGEVSVTFQVEGSGGLKVTVADTGEGIPQEKLDSVFLPYQQLSHTKGDLQSGTSQTGLGLGLSIVMQLVKVMDGQVTVSSELGQGSQFIIELPFKFVQREAVEGQEVDKEAVRDLPQFSYRVLVADDSQINRKVMQQYLTDLGCEVIEAENGKVALQVVESQPLDYVFLDIQMPVMDGVTAAHKIRAWMAEHKHSIRALFALTAGGKEAMPEAAYQEQPSLFDAWLEKPLYIETFVQLFFKLEGKKEGAFNFSQSFDSSKVDTMPPTKTDDRCQTLPEGLRPLFFQLVERLQTQQQQALQLLQQQELSKAAEVLHGMKGEAMVFQQQDWVDEIKHVEQQVKNNFTPAVIDTIKSWSFDCTGECNA